MVPNQSFPPSLTLLAMYGRLEKICLSQQLCTIKRPICRRMKKLIMQVKKLSKTTPYTLSKRNFTKQEKKLNRNVWE
uniref:Uncharacterized protein n=1 Tax=Trichobilharzia regenti TaxID=157069 RepID=A0AA85IWC6_TRIRE|nr:unnamed protein product [Trichobilharzia regenti]